MVAVVPHAVHREELPRRAERRPVHFGVHKTLSYSQPGPRSHELLMYTDDSLLRLWFTVKCAFASVMVVSSSSLVKV